jgi:hypothetical protein
VVVDPEVVSAAEESDAVVDADVVDVVQGTLVEVLSTVEEVVDVDEEEVVDEVPTVEVVDALLGVHATVVLVASGTLDVVDDVEDEVDEVDDVEDEVDDDEVDDDEVDEVEVEESLFEPGVHVKPFGSELDKVREMDIDQYASSAFVGLKHTTPAS